MGTGIIVWCLFLGTDSVPVKFDSEDIAKTLAELKVSNGDHFIVEDTNNSK